MALKVKEAWKVLRGGKTTEEPQVPRNMRGEIGYTGNLIFAGLPMDEYNPDLAFPKSLEVYDQMRRSDGQIAAVMNAMKLPIISAEWYVQADDDDAEGVQKSKAEEIAEFVEDNLIRGMRYSMADHLREALLMLDFGFSVFEKVYRFDTWKGRSVVMLDKYAPRVNASIWRFPQQDDNGDIVAVQQLNVYTGEYYNMPLDKVRLYTYQREGDNPVGISALRPAYKHWYIKSALERIIAVGVEKGLVGTPYATLPKGTSDKDRQAVLDTLTAMRVAEEAGATFPEGVVVSILEGKSNSINAMPFLEYQDTMIARSVMAQFLNLGTMSSASGGSYALGNTMVGMFVQSLEAIADYIAGEIQQDIEQLVEWNFGPDAPVPKLEHGKISIDSVAERLTAVGALGSGHMLNPDEALENELRKWLGVPPLTEQALINQRSMPTTNYIPPIVQDSRITQGQMQQIQTQQRAIGTSMKGLMQAGTPAPDTGQQAKQKMSDDEQGIQFTAAVQPAEGTPTARKTGGEKPLPPGQMPNRDLTPLEMSVDFAAIIAFLDAAEFAMQHMLKSAFSSALDTALRELQPKLELATTPTQALRVLQGFKVQLSPGVEKQLQSHLLRAVEFGQESVAKELRKSVSQLAIKHATEVLVETQVQTMLELQAEKVQGAAKLSALDVLQAMAGDNISNNFGDFTRRAIAAAKEGGEAYIDGNDLVLSANVSISQAMNVGRGSEAHKVGVQGAQWSAVMDQKTCELCGSLDGLVISADNPDFDIFRPPLHYNCRCILVYIGSNNTGEEYTWTTPDPALVKRYATFVHVH
ncbi:phage portal protein family protein [Alicyclobacillus sp. ALC3]|uniref:phage portal protein family protein n=1 Tax=Alicyclobacillus sp. ALC3 TaxID=2796143 RepID=UPI0023787BC5|nr:phage minor head protein [Alicyclobacillus sp. ALC3]WDL96396.1 minor capsid protein [Alicyclobacillus sp. ALC3]